LVGIALIGSLLVGTPAQAAPSVPAGAAADDAACGGPLALGTVVACPELAGGATHTYTVTTTVDGESLAARVMSPRQMFLPAKLTDADGKKVCDVFWDPTDCHLLEAGTYTLSVANTRTTGGNPPPAVDYTVSVDSRRSPAACVDLPATAFAIPTPGHDDTLPVGSLGQCYQFSQPAGALLRINMRPLKGGFDLLGAVYDASGDRRCITTTVDTCVLRGAGPHRLFVYEYTARTTPYNLKMMRLSDPDGCGAMSPSPFGDPGDRAGSGTLGDDWSPACFTFTAAAGPYLLKFGKEKFLQYTLYDRAGKELTCTWQTYGERCTLPAAGTYTLVFDDYPSKPTRDFQAAIYPLAGADGCLAGITLGAAPPTVDVTMKTAMQVDCHLVEASPGDRLKVSGFAQGWMANKADTRLCELGAAECVMSGAGPYRIISTGYWDDAADKGSYRLTARLLADAQGCVPVEPGRYRAAPSGPATTTACRLLNVPAAGTYRVELVGDKNKIGTGKVTDATGKHICDTGWCTFPAAGRYKLTASSTKSQATVLLSAAGGAELGCQPGTDDPSAVGRTVVFIKVGEYECLLLPTPAGSALTAMRWQDTSTPDSLQTSVFDATGAAVCDARQLADQTCVLRGVAPFRAVLHRDSNAVDVSEGFTLAFVRVGGAPACPVLAAGSFAQAVTGSVMMRNYSPVRCFSIPAGGHASAEVVSFSRVSGTGKARVVVFGENGDVACRTSVATADSAVCRLGAGAATVVIGSTETAQGLGSYGMFEVSRKDVTATAVGCRRIGSTAVGASSATGTLYDGSDVHCYEVPAAAADRLLIGARDAKGASRTLVLDPSGADAGCVDSVRYCSVTGHAGYRVLVSGEMVGDDTAAYELDAVKVWSAAGPPKECRTVPSLAYGFGPYTGTLNTNTPATCLVAARRPSDALTLSVTNPETATDGFRTGLFAVNADVVQPCPVGADAGRFTCPPATSAIEPTVFLLTQGERVTPHPYRWEATCTSPLCGDNRFAVTAVEPATVAAGDSRTLTIRGTSLHLKDTVRITAAGRAPVTATVTKVSADRTVLTAVVDLTSVPTGTVSVEVQAFGAGVGTAVLADALTVTAPVLKATTAPAISGKAVVGATVTASAGVWAPPATSYAYQWASNGTAITGATARTYVIPAAQLGKRLTVRVTATRDGAVPGTATSAQTAVVAKGAAPKASKKPTIRGTAKVGRTVTASTGTWSPKPDSYRYEWRIGGKVVKGATKASLKLTTAMRNKKLTVTVIAVKKGYVDGKSVSTTVTVKK
jgi:hypothetical protein